MFTHTVHFWLSPGLSAAERAAFVAGCRALAASPNVRGCRVGVPAGTPRPVVDNSWDVQLACVFADRAAHDAYQSADDAAHADFVARFRHCWTRVLIYDAVDAPGG